MAKDLIPRPQDALKTWAQNTKNKISVHGPALGLDPTEIANIENWCQALIDAIDGKAAAKSGYQSQVAASDTDLKDNIGLLRPKIQQIKISDSYTTAIGEDLDWIGEDTSFDPDAYKPEFKATLFPGYVRLDFFKKGVDGLNFYVRLKGGTTWTKLTYDTNSPYSDHTPLAVPGQPENREYMAIGVIDDEEIGLMSDIVSVVFGG